MGSWQRRVSALQLRVMALRASNKQHVATADAIRLKREIAQGLEMCRREWAAHSVPAPRRTVVEKSCAQMLDALVQIERSSGPADLDLAPLDLRGDHDRDGWNAASAAPTQFGRRPRAGGS